MYDINLFVEDFGHEAFLGALLQRLIEQYSIPVTVRFESSRGGHGVVIDELKTYIRDLGRGRKRLPDMILGRLLKSLRQKFQEWHRQMRQPELHEDSPAYVINTDSLQA
jgi:hypothetical protein